MPTMDEKTSKLLILVNAQLKAKGDPPLDTWTAGFEKLDEYRNKLLEERKASNGNGQSDEQPPKPSRFVPKKKVAKLVQPAEEPKEFKKNLKKAKAEAKAATPSTPKKKVKISKTADPNIITLKELCERWKLVPKAMRVKLRAAYDDPKRKKDLPVRLHPPSWEWENTPPNVKALEGVFKGT